MKVGTKEASTRFDVPASQDKPSYDGNVSDEEEDDIKVIPDEVDEALAKSSGPVKAISAVARKVKKNFQQKQWWPNLKVCRQEQGSSTQQQGFVWNTGWTCML